jgi:hypothetical protein
MSGSLEHTLKCHAIETHAPVRAHQVGAYAYHTIKYSYVH